jgi:peptidoglycan pentaglycine glycine transferase (the first glycine)
MPNYLLQWEAMNWARSLCCVSYDLWGIPDQVGQVVYEGKASPKAERTDGLWGVYRFKSGFSKNIVFHTGAYDYVYSPLLYVFITNKLLNGGRLDRIAVWMDSVRGA